MSSNLSNTISCILIQATLLVFRSIEAFGQCNAIPSAPTAPSHASLPTDGNLPNGSIYSLATSSQNITSNITTTGVSTIYITAGQTLTVGTGGANRNFNHASGNATVYIMAGATLTVNGDINGTTIYVYGTLNLTGNMNNINDVYVATTGVFNATSSSFNWNDSRVYVEGVMNITNSLNQFQGGISRACMNNGGCIRANNVKTVNTTNFHNTSGNGTFYYSGNSCDFSGSNNNLTSDASLKICANFASPCSRLGSGTNTFNCNPASGTCAGAIALPIILAYFNSEKTSEGIRLNWATIYQINTSHFVVEKSSNGIDWKDVDIINAKEIQNGMHEYSIMDNNPTIGTTYYRLKEIDNGDKATVYSVIVEDFSAKNGIFALYPNPTDQFLTVFVLNDFPIYDLQIIDSKGAFVTSYKLTEGENKLYIKANPGLHLAKLKVGPDYRIQKFIIQ